MKRFSQQLKKQANSIRMSTAEKSDLKDRLQAYMEYHPLPTELAEQSVATAKTIKSEAFVLWRFNTPQLRSGVGVFFALMLVIVPVFAERSVPGDVLYPVKVQFNEEVRSTLSLSPYQRVEWETRRLERRIAEARFLAESGQLTEEVEAEVAEAVKGHSAAAQAEIDTIRETDSDEAAIAGIALTSALEVQSEVLDSDNGESGSVGVLAGVVDAEVAEAVASQADEQPSYARLIARVEIETTQAEEYLNSLDESLSEAERAEVNRRLEDIARKVGEAAESYDPAVVASDAAIALLKQALSDTQKLIAYLTDIDVKENVAIESLVPVTLTEDERVALAEAALVTIAADQATIETLLEQVTDESQLEKIAFGLELSVESAAAATLMLEAEDVTAAESAVAEATELLSDILRSLALEGIEPGSAPVVVPDTSIGTSTESGATTTDEVIEEELESEEELTEEAEESESPTEEVAEEEALKTEAETETSEEVETTETNHRTGSKRKAVAVAQGPPRRLFSSTPHIKKHTEPGSGGFLLLQSFRMNS